MLTAIPKECFISADRMYNSLILVVDDIELNRKILSHSLQAHGYKNVITTTDGSEALKITQEQNPALVILDLMMPKMDGFAYLKAIRQDGNYNTMPIIVQTALDDIERKLEAFDLGASDYICKPVEPRELSARVQVHLSNTLLMDDLRLYKKRMGEELELAQKMQNRLMPNSQQVQMCERVFNLKIASHFETSSDLGGDCWGIRPLSDNRLAIYTIDFSGHGMSSAMNVFRMHTIMQELLHAGGDPGNFLATLNRHLHPLLERDEFATMFYGIIDTDANCLLYSSAGAPSPILISSLEAEPQMLNGRGFPLGVLPNATYETKYTPFMSRNLLLLYSDCLTEAKNEDGEALPEEEIKKLVKTIYDEQQQGNPAKHIVGKLSQAIKEHSPNPLPDDLTITAYFRVPK